MAPERYRHAISFGTFVAHAPHMKFSRTFLALIVLVASSAPGVALQSDLCPGKTVDIEIEGFSGGTVPYVNDDMIAFAHFGLSMPGGGLGGVNVFRVDTSVNQVRLVDELVVPGIGVESTEQILGSAIASSGAVLYLRHEPSTIPATLFQLRRTSPTGPVDVRAIQAPQPIGWTESGIRFDSDGDHAVLTTIDTASSPVLVSLHFFAVDAAGDWFLEESIRAAEAVSQFFVHDVHLRGNQVLLELPFDGSRAYERSSQGD